MIKLVRVERNPGLKDAKDLLDDPFSVPGIVLQGFLRGRSPVAVSA